MCSSCVDDEAVDLADELTVGRSDGARAANLHLALRHAVVGHAVRVEVAGEGTELASVVRHREHVLDTYVPLRIADGELTEAEVRRLLERGELCGGVDRAAER